MDPKELEEAYQGFVSNLGSWIPDGIIDVNLALLDELGLLNVEEFEETSSVEELPHYFHVIETSEKVTLFNHQFAVWIVPQNMNDNPITIVFIALLTKKEPHLEIVFSTSGVYNTPKFVLKVLRHYLSEVIDTEEAISSIGNS